MKSMDRVTVVGAGTFGTTLAAVASAGGPVTLWALEPAVADWIRGTRENAVYLPGFALPEALDATSDLDAALAGADIVILAVPARHMASVITKAAPAVPASALIVSATKGIEPHSGRRMSEVLSAVLPDHARGADRRARRAEPRPRGHGRAPVGDVRRLLRCPSTPPASRGGCSRTGSASTSPPT